MGTNARRRFASWMVIAAMGVGVAHFAVVAEGGTWGEDQVLFASDPTVEDYFGYAVATDGSTVMVGAIYDDQMVSPYYGNAGSVRVFEPSGGLWTEVDRLVPQSEINSGYFGASIAIDGDTAVIGSYGRDYKIGAAYVFVKETGVWVEQAKLEDTDPQQFDSFGYSVAIDGDTVVVGAYLDDFVTGSDDDRGSISVFTRSGATWLLEQKLTLASQLDGDWFGFRVAVEGDTLVASALEAGTGHPDGNGSVYVFTRTGSYWAEGQKLNGSGGADDRNFGNGIQLSGGTLVIGSPRTDHSGLDNAGAVYVFTESGGVWTETQKMTASDAADDGGLGNSVALAGDRMIVGADIASPRGVYRAGEAYVFENDGGAWVERHRLVADSPESEARLGFSIAGTQEIAVVGGPWTDSVSPAAASAGAVCTYDHASFVFADGFEGGDMGAWD